MKSEEKKPETPTDNVYLVKISHDTLGGGIVGKIHAIDRDEAFKILKNTLKEKGFLGRLGVYEELYCLTRRGVRIQLSEKIAPLAQKIEYIKHYLD